MSTTPDLDRFGVVQPLQAELDETAQRIGFSGVVRLDVAGTTELCSAYGYADRAHEVSATVDTRFGIASGTKTLTALTVMGLIERGVLELGATARSVLGDDLPLIADDVTVEHLLAHRSGIGDYLDEDVVGDVTDYVMRVPVHQLASTEAYIPVLDGHQTVFPAGERFVYNNAGYVVLALLAERASGVAFDELVRTMVCVPAGMPDTAFLRSDELPGDAALGYLDASGVRTNVLHLPVLGSGDGGVYTTVADLHRLWTALLEGRIVRPAGVAELVRPRSDWPSEQRRYGLGLHLHATGDAVWMEGADAGVSFVSLHDPASSTTYSVVSNWSRGAWPLVALLNRRLGI